MATRQFDSVLQQIRRLAEGREGNPWTDRQLLDRFMNKNEEAAFAALVRRHGPMVLSLGWRILRDREDAEDVFQAAFLVLARKARSIHKQDSIGGWLYRVAFRLALRVRAQAAKRCRPLLSKPEASPADPLAEISWREICAALDEELARLPNRLRAPLVLCYLEGKTQDEAQHQLGWSKNTFRRRLEEGRNRLCSRLTRRGITLSAGLWATLLSDPGASAAVPAALWQATVRAAMAFAAGEIAGAAVSPQVSLLIKEGLKSAFVCKMKWVALAGMVTVLTTGMGLAAHQALKANQATGAASEPLALADERRDQPKLEKANQALVDRYGDPLPPGARVRMGSIRLRPAEGGKSSGYYLEFLPGGKVLATEGYKGIRFWDVSTGKETRRIEAPGGGTWSFALSPDGKTLAASCFDDTSGLADSTALIWDLAPDTWRAGMTSRELTREDLDRTWADLAGQDAAKGHQAIWTLVAVPGQAVALFKERLQPASEQEQKRIQQWIAELDHAQFTVRERASRELEQCGGEAEVALLRVLRQNPSTEVRKRIEALLDLPQIIRSGECLRRLRAIQALEHIQTPEAEKVLKSLAQGAPEARLTQEAKASVERLAKRPSVRP